MILTFYCSGITAYCQVTADFTANITSGCTPLLVEFTDLSTGGATSWSWDFGNGNNSNIKDPGVIYINPGIYTITLVASNISGSSTKTKTAYIMVYASPKADFGADKTIGCAPLLVNFADHSSAGSSTIVEWLWDFGGGNINTAQNPTYTYNSSGSYPVYLLVKDDNGCTNFTFVNDYIVVGKVKASFVIDTIICPSLSPVNFLNTSTGSGLSYDWDLGDGTTATTKDVTHSYASSGGYQVQLIVTDAMGCTDTTIQNFDLMDLTTNFGFKINSVNCKDSTFTVIFTDSSLATATGWFWDFGDGDTSIYKNPVHTFSTIGTYNVTLRSDLSTGCSDTEVKSVSYYLPIAAFSVDTSYACQLPFTVNFTNESSGNAPLIYKWFFGDGATSSDSNTTYIYTSNGIFSDSLVVQDIFGCKDDTLGNIRIEKPFANFSSSTILGCAPLVANFTNTSISIDSIVKYEWSFGDIASGANDSSTLKEPNHIYNDPGIYTVTLTITNSKGCKDTFQEKKYIKVGLMPDYVNFTISPNDTICHGYVVQFFDSSGFFDTSIHINYWCWNFHFRPSDPSHDANVCGDSGINVIDLYYATIQDPIYKYDDFIIDINDTVIGGDSICITIFEPIFGSDTVRLIVAYNGCYDTIIKTVFINAPMAMPGIIFPDSNRDLYTRYIYDTLGAIIDSEVVCGSVLGDCTGPITLGFFNASARYDSFIYCHIIHKKSGDTLYQFTGPDDTVFLNLTRAGTYEIEISVRNDTTGCQPIERFDFVIDSVVYGFFLGPDSDCMKGNEIVFSDTTNSYYSDIFSWLWTFGDGDTSSKPNPTHKYEDTGLFVVASRVKVLLGNGLPDQPDVVCEYVAYDTVRIFNVAADFAVDTSKGCPNTIFDFTDLSISTSTIQSWLWNFGDGSPNGTLQNPTHIYSPGVYDVSLIVENMQGCIDTISKDSTVIVTQPIANFNIMNSSICFGDSLRLTNRSSGIGISYLWDFGNGDTSVDMNPSHLYTTSGNYTITLTVTDTNSCDSILVKSNAVTVFDYPTAGFFVDTNASDCPPFLVRFTDTSVANIDSWEWDFGDGQTSLIQHPTHIYTTSDSFNVTLIVTNISGCVDTLVIPGVVIIGGPDGAFTFDPDTGCIPVDVQFIPNYTKSDFFYWDFGDGNVQILSSIDKVDTVNHTYTAKGVYLPNLVIQDSLGCDYITPSFDSIVADDILASYSFIDTIKCGFGPVSFNNTSIIFLPALYTWDFRDGDTSHQVSPVHLFDSAGVFDVILSAVSIANCRSSDTNQITIYESPDVLINTLPDTGCVPFTVDFTVGDTTGVITTWEWDFGNGSVTQGTSASHNYDQKGQFEVQLSATFGQGNCQEDTFAIIYASGWPVAGFWYDPERPSLNYPIVQFWDVSAGARSWLWFFNESDSSILQDPEYSYDTSGHFIVKLIITNEFGCTDTVFKNIYIAPEVIYEIPSAFSPNGDGINDIFYFFNAGIEELVTFTIYDRWGHRVFETSDLNEGWDGTHNGNKQPMDTYVYYLIAKVAGSEKEILLKGDLTLIR